METVRAADFAASFGTTEEDIRNKCSDIMLQKDFSYRLIAGPDRDRMLLQILKSIDSQPEQPESSARQLAWRESWEENLHEFLDSSYNLSALIPKFVRAGQPIRWQQQYVQPVNPFFELDFYSIFREWFFKTYFEQAAAVYEFGCGTGYNLVALSELYPEKELCGLDYASSSLELVNKVAEAYELKLRAAYFDMLEPDSRMELQKNSAVFTIGSIEHLNGQFEPFINYLLTQPISCCVNVEPAAELYDPESLADYLALKFQQKRCCTSGFLPYLEDLEKQGRIVLKKVKRLFFGSMLMERYNIFCWTKR